MTVYMLRAEESLPYVLEHLRDLTKIRVQTLCMLCVRAANVDVHNSDPQTHARLKQIDLPDVA